MEISVIVPALTNKGPILVARDIILNLTKLYADAKFYLFYFDEIHNPIEAGCPTFSIKDSANLEKLYTSDIVHSHGIRPDFYVFKNRRRFKGKCVSTLHGLIGKEYAIQFGVLGAKIIELLWTRILRRHDKVVALTEVMRQHYSPYFSPNLLQVINNGRNISSKNIDEQDVALFFDLEKRYKILGVACVLTKRKGLHQVIDSLTVLNDYAFVIIGDGPERRNLEKRAVVLGVGDRCVFLGSRAEANRYNRFFDYYIFPSYMEGLPLSLLEAAGVGKAIICSDINIHREIFKENEVSFFQLDNIEDLKRAVEHAYNNKSKLELNVVSAYKKKFTADVMADCYGKLYRNLLNAE